MRKTADQAAPANEARMRTKSVRSRPEEGPDHEHHGHVAHAQPFLLADEPSRRRRRAAGSPPPDDAPRGARRGRSGPSRKNA
ncbi:MAG: hypothetical protein MZV64_63350 [Ignavibacteriales bacterium]|nr:hypothetical protein [Ignavibacteriales bacterium]